jgi:transcriptional regulator with XRE-family HTH domain
MEIVALQSPTIARRRASIGRLVAHHRKGKRLSAEQAASKLGVHRTTWVRWEAGKTSIPSELLPEVARIVDACAEDLIAGRRAA